MERKRLRIGSIVLVLLTITILSLNIGTISADETVTYPEGYTHRPLLEFFTSLSYPPCMDNAHPAMEEVMEDAHDVDGVPFNLVVFHQNIPGNDNLTTSECTERLQYYQDDLQEGVPNMIFDGGYDELNPSSSDAIQNDIESAGSRDVGKATLWVRFIIQNDKINWELKIHNVEENSMTGRMYLFVIENGVWAYSTYKDKYMPSDHVFRGYALEDEGISVGGGEWVNLTDSWNINTSSSVPINQNNLTVVAAVYDSNDHDVAPIPNGDFKNLAIPRCIQSATPETTEFDGGFPETPIIPSDIDIRSVDHQPSNPTENDMVTISAEIESAHTLSTVSLTYEVNGEDRGPTTMGKSTGDIYTEEIGPFNSLDTISYKVIARDENGAEEESIEYEFTVAESGSVPVEGDTEIKNIRINPTVPKEGDYVNIYVEIESDNIITSVKLYYTENDGNEKSKSMKKSGAEYKANLNPLTGGTKLSYYVTVEDNKENTVQSEENSIIIQSIASDDGADNSDSPGFSLLIITTALIAIVIAKKYQK